MSMPHGETIGAMVMARGMLVGNERRDMRGDFDLGALVVVARMAGEKFGAIDNAHFVRIGEHGEQALHAGVRHSVIVETISGKGLSGSGNSRVASSAKASRTVSVCCSGHGRSAARRCTRLRPGDRRDQRTCERRRSWRAHSGWRARPAFLVAARHRHWPRLVATVSCECEQRRVEPDGVADTFQHGAFEIVVQQDTCTAIEGLECRDMAT
jgi:hypothetical protein